MVTVEVDKVSKLLPICTPIRRYAFQHRKLGVELLPDASTFNFANGQQALTSPSQTGQQNSRPGLRVRGRVVGSVSRTAENRQAKMRRSAVPCQFCVNFVSIFVDFCQIFGCGVGVLVEVCERSAQGHARVMRRHAEGGSGGGGGGLGRAVGGWLSGGFGGGVGVWVGGVCLVVRGGRGGFWGLKGGLEGVGLAAAGRGWGLAAPMPSSRSFSMSLCIGSEPKSQILKEEANPQPGRHR